MDVVEWAQLLMRGHSASRLGAMESLPDVAALSRCSVALAQDWVGLGWNVQRLGTLVDVEEHDLEGVALSLEETYKRPIRDP